MGRKQATRISPDLSRLIVQMAGGSTALGQALGGKSRSRVGNWKTRGIPLSAFEEIKERVGWMPMIKKIIRERGL